MTINQYFYHYDATNEQDLIEDLTIESIQAQGIDVAYIPRSQTVSDYLYNEDPTNVFQAFDIFDPLYYEEGHFIQDVRKIEMWPASVEGFDGEQLMTIFGDEFKKSAIFIVSRKRFKEEFPEYLRPREGDLLFMPITNAVLEIKFVEHESPFFEKGKQYVYELKLEAFEFSYEDIRVSDADIDSVLDEMDVPNQDTTTEEYGDNEEIDDDTGDDINFDPSNPFSLR